ILTLEEVRRYGADSFSDDDYLSLYGMKPAEWHARGIRLLGRTAVECTRDVLGDRIGRDVGAAAASFPRGTPVTVIDPFAGSFNTLYSVLRSAPSWAIVSAATLERRPPRCREARPLPSSILLPDPATRFTGSSVTCRPRKDSPSSSIRRCSSSQVATSPVWIGALPSSTATSSPASTDASCPRGMRC